MVYVLMRENKGNLQIVFFIFETFLGRDCLLFTPKTPV